jgi:tetratricopeptide (TPR) repeat protein
MKNTLASVALLLGLVLLGTQASAQTGGVRGRVLTPDGEPVADATLRLEYQGSTTREYEVKTNEKGEYLQIGMYPGLYRITATAEGYDPTVVEQRVALGDMTEAEDIELKPAAPKVDPAVVELKEKFAEAIALTDARKYDEAEALYREILAKQPDIPEALENLAYVSVQKEDWPSAQESYEKLLELQPDDTEVMTALAMVYQRSGQDEKATEMMGRAAEANPADAVAQFNRGALLLNSGDSAGAAEAFQKALAADPSLNEAHYYLGTILVGQGQIPQAIEHLETYLASNPAKEQNAATARKLLEALKK